MGQEFELKYTATEAAFAALQQQYPYLAPITMETVYFDAVDGALSKRHWTLRRRVENGKTVCALKTPGNGIVRGEWEVSREEMETAIEALCGQGAPEELRELTQVGIRPVCGARFVRLAGILEIPGCSVELALDKGEFLAGERKQPFMELEVELKEGSEIAAVAFGEQLARNLGLQVQTHSKFARAMALAAEGGEEADV